ncbi:MAG: hypothetical protein GWO04_07175, partial [Actinobacteria bacterium]|nr:hypothetical protein [Actinomycetota bacterium]
MISSQVIDADAGGTIRGYDHNSADDCSGGGAVAITAAIARGAVTEDTP